MATIRDFTPDLIEMILVAGIPAVLMYALRMGKKSVKRTRLRRQHSAGPVQRGPSSTEIGSTESQH